MSINSLEANVHSEKQGAADFLKLHVTQRVLEQQQQEQQQEPRDGRQQEQQTAEEEQANELLSDAKTHAVALVRPIPSRQQQQSSKYTHEQTHQQDQNYEHEQLELESEKQRLEQETVGCVDEHNQRAIRSSNRQRRDGTCGSRSLTETSCTTAAVQRRRGLPACRSSTEAAAATAAEVAATTEAATPARSPEAKKRRRGKQNAPQASRSAAVEEGSAAAATAAVSDDFSVIEVFAFSNHQGLRPQLHQQQQKKQQQNRGRKKQVGSEDIIVYFPASPNTGKPEAAAAVASNHSGSPATCNTLTLKKGKTRKPAAAPAATEAEVTDVEGRKSRRSNATASAATAKKAGDSPLLLKGRKHSGESAPQTPLLLRRPQDPVELAEFSQRVRQRLLLVEHQLRRLQQEQQYLLAALWDLGPAAGAAAAATASEAFPALQQRPRVSEQLLELDRLEEPPLQQNGKEGKLVLQSAGDQQQQQHDASHKLSEPSSGSKVLCKTLSEQQLQQQWQQLQFQQQQLKLQQQHVLLQQQLLAAALLTDTDWEKAIRREGASAASAAAAATPPGEEASAATTKAPVRSEAPLAAAAAVAAGCAANDLPQAAAEAPTAPLADDAPAARRLSVPLATECASPGSARADDAPAGLRSNRGGSPEKAGTKMPAATVAAPAPVTAHRSTTLSTGGEAEAAAATVAVAEPVVAGVNALPSEAAGATAEERTQQPIEGLEAPPAERQQQHKQLEPRILSLWNIARTCSSSLLCGPSVSEATDAADGLSAGTPAANSSTATAAAAAAGEAVVKASKAATGISSAVRGAFQFSNLLRPRLPVAPDPAAAGWTAADPAASAAALLGSGAASLGDGRQAAAAADAAAACSGGTSQMLLRAVRSPTAARSALPAAARVRCMAALPLVAAEAAEDEQYICVGGPGDADDSATGALLPAVTPAETAGAAPTLNAAADSTEANRTASWGEAPAPTPTAATSPAAAKREEEERIPAMVSSPAGAAASSAAAAAESPSNHCNSSIADKVSRSFTGADSSSGAAVEAAAAASMAEEDMAATAAAEAAWLAAGKTDCVGSWSLLLPPSFGCIFPEPLKQLLFVQQQQPQQIREALTRLRRQRVMNKLQLQQLQQQLQQEPQRPQKQQQQQVEQKQHQQQQVRQQHQRLQALTEGLSFLDAFLVAALRCGEEGTSCRCSSEACNRRGQYIHHQQQQEQKQVQQQQPQNQQPGQVHRSRLQRDPLLQQTPLRGEDAQCRWQQQQQQQPQRQQPSEEPLEREEAQQQEAEEHLQPPQQPHQGTQQPVETGMCQQQEQQQQTEPIVPQQAEQHDELLLRRMQQPKQLRQQPQQSLGEATLGVQPQHEQQQRDAMPYETEHPEEQQLPQPEQAEQLSQHTTDGATRGEHRLEEEQLQGGVEQVQQQEEEQQMQQEPEEISVEDAPSSADTPSPRGFAYSPGMCLYTPDSCPGSPLSCVYTPGNLPEAAAPVSQEEQLDEHQGQQPLQQGQREQELQFSTDDGCVFASAQSPPSSSSSSTGHSTSHSGGRYKRKSQEAIELVQLSSDSSSDRASCSSQSDSDGGLQLPDSPCPTAVGETAREEGTATETVVETSEPEARAEETGETGTTAERKATAAATQTGATSATGTAGTAEAATVSNEAFCVAAAQARQTAPTKTAVSSATSGREGPAAMASKLSDVATTEAAQPPAAAAIREQHLLLRIDWAKMEASCLHRWLSFFGLKVGGLSQQQAVSILQQICRYLVTGTPHALSAADAAVPAAAGAEHIEGTGQQSAVLAAEMQRQQQAPDPEASDPSTAAAAAAAEGPATQARRRQKRQQRGSGSTTNDPMANAGMCTPCPCAADSTSAAEALLPVEYAGTAAEVDPSQLSSQQQQQGRQKRTATAAEIRAALLREDDPFGVYGRLLAMEPVTLSEIEESLKAAQVTATRQSLQTFLRRAAVMIANPWRPQQRGSRGPSKLTSKDVLLTPDNSSRSNMDGSGT